MGGNKKKKAAGPPPVFATSSVKSRKNVEDEEKAQREKEEAAAAEAEKERREAEEERQREEAEKIFTYYLQKSQQPGDKERPQRGPVNYNSIFTDDGHSFFREFFGEKSEIINPTDQGERGESWVARLS